MTLTETTSPCSWALKTITVPGAENLLALTIKFENNCARRTGVANHGHVVRRQRLHQGLPALRQERLRRVDRAGDHVAQQNRARLQGDFSGADARCVEQVVDQAQQMCRLATDDGHQLGHALVARVYVAHDGVGDGDGRHRIAQFMRQHRQEHGLALDGRLGRRLRILGLERGQHQMLIGFAQQQRAVAFVGHRLLLAQRERPERGDRATQRTGFMVAGVALR